MTAHFVVDIDAQSVEIRSTAPVLLLGQQGAIIGHLFRRNGLMQKVDQLSEEEVGSILSSVGRALIEHYWGGYVAVICCADGTTSIIRDPSGTMPCYWSEQGGAVRCSNDIEDVACWNRKASVDLGKLARYLASPGYWGCKTGLAGVQELIAGGAVSSGHGPPRPNMMWSPWDHVAPQREIAMREAADQLEHIITGCIASWASCFENVVIGVSGGLDSSIVACSAAPHTSLRCLNMYADDAEGDERRYAKMLTDSLGLDLLTGHFEISDIELDKAILPHRAWPNASWFALSIERRHAELDKQRTISAYFSGNGGDNIFCATRSASPFLDRLAVEGPGFGLKSTLADLCRLTETDTGTVLKTAWQQYLKSRKGIAAKTDFTGLSKAILPISPLQHPWRRAPKGALVGKSGHVGFLAGAQQSLELYARNANVPHIAPLLSQPIVEHCLSIPTWLWIEDGVDRAVARNAFRHRLPEALIGRSSKGGPGGFVQKTFLQNSEQIRRSLLDGTLVREGILDADYIGAEDDLSWRGNSRSQRLLQFQSAENWLRYWLGRKLKRDFTGYSTLRIGKGSSTHPASPPIA